MNGVLFSQCHKHTWRKIPDYRGEGRSRLDFRRFLESSLCFSPTRGGEARGSFPEQQLVIEPTVGPI